MVSNFRKIAIFVCKITLKNLIFKLDFKGVYFGRYALCDAIYTCFQAPQSLEQKEEKNLQGKVFCKCGLRFVERKVDVSTKVLLEKNSKTKNN